MSQDNMDVVRHVYDGWSRGDFSRGDVFDPEIEFELVDWPEPARTRGLEAMRDAWLATLSAWDHFRAVPHDFIEAGPHVVVLNRIHAKGKSSSVEVSAETASVWTMEAGKVVRLALYWNIARAFEAAGLPPQERPP
jgi:ketosteroid isomerase-like protein